MITGTESQQQAIAMLTILLTPVLFYLMYKLVRYACKKTTKEIKSPANPGIGCNQLATLEDWQEFGNE